MTESPRLEIRSLHLAFGETEVIRDLSLTVQENEFVSILGPSGSGKSTALSVLTGALKANSGDVLIEGKPLPDNKSQFAYLPQRDALFPWRRIIDNLTVGLEVQGIRKSEARRRVTPLLEAFGIAGFEHFYPFQLSGGMRQRAALLRTVVQERGILLLDEPFGALDALTREQMHSWVEEVRERSRWTVLLVTHDVREAVFLSDRIYVFSDRPATVVSTIEVPFPHPRTIDTMADPRFARIEADLLHTLLHPPAR